MHRALIGSVIIVTAVLFAGLVFAHGDLDDLDDTHKDMFKRMVKNFFSPEINGWGIGLNTATDTYLVAKFHGVSVKTLPRSVVNDIIRQAKAENITDWDTVRDRIQAALQANGTVKSKGRIKINKINYILTGISKSESTFSADIKNLPDFDSCKDQNVSAEDCENQAAKVGDLSLARKTAEFEEKARVWAGTMNFNSSAYTFVALVNPRGK